jgi:hypothetical protein
MYFAVFILFDALNCLTNRINLYGYASVVNKDKRL